MSESFWDYMFSHPRTGADGFGDYIRLMRMGKISRPEDVVDRRHLKRILEREGVDVSAERVTQLWRAYTTQHQHNRLLGPTKAK